MPAVIDLQDVSRHYVDGESVVRALDGVSLSIPQGELVAVTGPSGSGKSTLLNLVGALDRPTSGTVKLAGADLGTLSDDDLTEVRRLRIGFVFQFFNLLPTMSAVENVMLPALLAGRSRREMREKAGGLLDRVKLGHRAEHRPQSLSGGEMQRVAVARALILDPPVLLADEPTGNLDRASGEEVLRLLRATTDDARTVIVVTHDPRVAGFGDRIVALRDGRIEADRAVEAAAGE
jgi:putative ABC transport system ATP-binding protein